MGFFARIPQLWRYIAVAVFSLCISILGVLWAVHEQCPSLGGIGGAFGTAAAFASLFLRPDYGLQIYELIKRDIHTDLPKFEQLEEELKAVVAALRVNSNGQAIQNSAIAIASIIGTVFWALGEYFAKWLLQGHF